MPVRKMFLALALVVATPLPGLAYTLVLRTGQRVDIGVEYQLNGSTLVYRTGGGAVQSIALHVVDLEKTAELNHESVDAFVRRGMNRPTPTRATQTTAVDGVADEPVTLTNGDFEAYRIVRERLDSEYQERHPDTGLNVPVPVFPSGQSYGADGQQRIGGLTESEWRAKANYYADEYFALQAQIDDVAGQIDERERHPFDYGLSYTYNYGARPLSLGAFYNRDYNGPIYLRSDVELAALTDRLSILRTRVADIQYRRDIFLERARRAGVPPGWLRD